MGIFPRKAATPDVTDGRRKYRALRGGGGCVWAAPTRKGWGGVGGWCRPKIIVVLQMSGRGPDTLCLRRVLRNTWAWPWLPETVVVGQVLLSTRNTSDVDPILV